MMVKEIYELISEKHLQKYAELAVRIGVNVQKINYWLFIVT